jgi:hypothetical protein
VIVDVVEIVEHDEELLPRMAVAQARAGLGYLANDFTLAADSNAL